MIKKWQLLFNRKYSMVWFVNKYLPVLNVSESETEVVKTFLNTHHMNGTNDEWERRMNAKC